MERTRGQLEKIFKEERANKGVQDKMDAQIKSTSSPPQSPGAISAKSDAQAAYGLGFGRSLYAWKDQKITFLMEPVLCQNSSGVIGS
jgi:hypothetical protein